MEVLSGKTTIKLKANNGILDINLDDDSKIEPIGLTTPDEIVVYSKDASADGIVQIESDSSGDAQLSFSSGGYIEVDSSSDVTLFGKATLTVNKATIRLKNVNQKGSEYGWEYFKPLITIPALRLTRRKTDDGDESNLNVSFLSSIGFGFSFRKFDWIKGVKVRTIDISPIFLLSQKQTELSNGNTETEYSLALALSAGFWDNIFQVGVGYDFGDIPENQTGRVFVLLGTGGNLNFK